MSPIARLVLVVGLVVMRYFGGIHVAPPTHVTPPPPVGVAAPHTAHLLFTQQPTDAVQNRLILPGVAVSVADDSGRALADVPVTISSDDLGGVTTVLTDVKGVARFDTLAFPHRGTHTLHAATGSLPVVDSVPFAVF